jgi:hypothetical protein
MAFGTLGATSSAAVDNAKTLLEMIKALASVPKDVMADLTNLLESIVKREASTIAREETVSAREQAVQKREDAIQGKQDAIDQQIAKLKKLME